jgi:hypothetical protein
MPILLLKSEDRADGSVGSHDFRLDFTRSFAVKKKIQLVGASLQSSIYNITSSNNTLTINDESINIPASISAGLYTPDELATTLEADWNAAASAALSPITISVSYDQISGKYTIVPSAGTIFIVSGSSMAKTLGFLENSNSVTSTALISPNIAGINSPTMLNVHIREFPMYVYTSGGDVNTFSLAVDPDSNLNIDNNNLSLQDIKIDHPLEFNSLHIQLRSDNESVDLNGVNWVLLVKIE